VDVKFAEAYVSPLGMVIDESTVPTVVSDEDRPIVVSCCALAGFPVESCSWTNMHWLVLLSESTPGDPVKSWSFVGFVACAKCVVWFSTTNATAIKRIASVIAVFFSIVYFLHSL
jgi:hypothetical protein